MQNKINRQKIAYLGALTLLFSYAELFLPRFVPFFRLGLGNIIILLALNLDFGSFLLLNLIKVAANAMLNGILFSPFMLISLAQGFSSGIVMYILAAALKNRHLISIYGISLAGSAVSAVVQIFTSSLYLGSGTYSLLGPMLIFSIFSALITAFLSEKLHIPNTTPELLYENSDDSSDGKIGKSYNTVIIICILLSATLSMMTKGIIVLCAGLIVAVVMQLLCGRKIFVIPHLSLWLFVIFCSILSPNGKVLAKIFNFSITQGAILSGIEKAIKLSTTMALSQSAASLRPETKSNSILNLSLAYFGGLSNEFRKIEGKLLAKIKGTLSCEKLCATIKTKRGISVKKAVITAAIFIILFGIQLIAKVENF